MPQHEPTTKQHVIIKSQALANRAAKALSLEIALAHLAREAGAPFSDELLPTPDPRYEWKLDERDNGDVKISWRRAEAENDTE